MRFGRSLHVLKRLTALVLAACLITVPARAETFEEFLTALWPDANTAGVSRATFDHAVSGLTPDYKLPDLVLPGRPKVDNTGQAEFSKTAADYISKPYMEKLAAQGRTFFAKHRAALTAHRAKDWRRSLHPGCHLGARDRLRVLQAAPRCDPRAGDARLYRATKGQFRAELLAALKMLELGIPRSDMKSSWAGAVGLTQFMPTEYLKFADDGDGDGKADIWRSVQMTHWPRPRRQLEGKGWKRGQGLGL